MLVQSRSLFIKNIGLSVFGLVYISLSIGLLIALRTGYGLPLQDGNADLYKKLPLQLIFSLWINDTMAYIVGSLIGKTQLSPVSPKKTWEGTAGGFILCLVLMYFIGIWMGIEGVHALVIAAITSISGTFGDLFESRLKRLAGVKDSAQIMPGHGGFLDRFDSLLFSSTFAWIYALSVW